MKISKVLWMTVQAAAVLAIWVGLIDDAQSPEFRQRPFVAFFIAVVVVAFLTGVITKLWDWLRYGRLFGLRR